MKGVEYTPPPVTVKFELPSAEEFEEFFNTYSRKVNDFFMTMHATISKGSDDISSELFLSLITKITFSAILPIASTMGVSYFFQRLTAGLTNPALAQEIRMVHPYDQRKKALKSIAGPAFAAAGTSFFFISYVPPFKSLLRSANCFIREYTGLKTNPWCYQLPPSIKLIGGVSLACGAIAAAYSGIKVLYEEYKANIKKEEDLPILNPETTIALNRIAKSTCDLKEKEGFLQNVLFFGPGGTGKTMAAKAIAKNSDMNFVMMSGGDLPQYLQKKTHVSELNKLFAQIKGFVGPTVLFIDEAESLCRKRSDLLGMIERIELLNAFLNATGDNSKKIMLVLATNRPEDLDEAVLSRMDHKLFLGPPAYQQRKEIVQMYVKKTFTDEKELALFDEKTLNDIASQTEGMTGRALFKMINALSSNKILEKDRTLSKELIESTVKQFVTQESKLAKPKTVYESAKSKTLSLIGRPL